MMRFKEGKYGKLFERKKEMQLPKNVKMSVLPCFRAYKYNFINNFIVRFMYEDVTPS